MALSSTLAAMLGSIKDKMDPSSGFSTAKLQPQDMMTAGALLHRRARPRSLHSWRRCRRAALLGPRPSSGCSRPSVVPTCKGGGMVLAALLPPPRAPRASLRALLRRPLRAQPDKCSASYRDSSIRRNLLRATRARKPSRTLLPSWTSGPVRYGRRSRCPWRRSRWRISPRSYWRYGRYGP